jgi:tape measure domain-containing protein
MSQIKTSVVVGLIDRVTSPIKRTRAALDNLGKLQGTIQSFQSLSAKTLATRTQLGLAQQSVRSLSAQMAASASPTRALSNSFAQARQQAGALLVQLDREEAELRHLRGTLKGAGVDTANLGRHMSQLAGRASQLSVRLRVLQGTRNVLAGLGAGISRVGEASVAASARIARWATGAAAATAAMGFGFNRLFLSTAASFEKYRLQLESLEGSSAKAATSMRWVEKFAATTPFEIDGVMQSFVKLRAFGMDPMNGTMQAIADQTAKLGGGQMEMEGVVLALGQAWTKQKLQGEEALQLIERGVPVWDLLSKATGKTTAELQKMSEKGQLGRTAISLLIEEMGKSSGGAAAKQMTSWNGMISNLKDGWQRFANSVANAGMFDALKGRLASVLATIERMSADGSLAKLAKQVSDGVITALNIIVGLGKGIATVFRLVAAVIKPVVQMFELIGDGWNKIFDVIDKVSGSNIRESIGKSTASLLAGFGNESAGQALATNEVGAAASITTPSARAKPQRYGPPVLVADNGSARRPTEKSDVGGTVKIVIDNQGKASVGNIKPNNPAVDYQVDRGLHMAN